MTSPDDRETDDPLMPRPAAALTAPPSGDRVCAAAFRCALCPALFADRLALAAHERSHGAALRCAVCARSFRLEGALRRHLRRHAPPAAGETPATDSVAVDDDRVIGVGSERPARHAAAVEAGCAAEMAATCEVNTGEVEGDAPSTTAGVGDRLAGKRDPPAGTTEDLPEQEIPALQGMSHLPDGGSGSLLRSLLVEKHASQIDNPELRAESHPPPADNDATQVPEAASLPVTNTPHLSRPHPAAIPPESGGGDPLKLPFQCALCQARFGLVSRLQKHVKGHAKSGRRPRMEREVGRRGSRGRLAAGRRRGEGVDAEVHGDGVTDSGATGGGRRAERTEPPSTGQRNPEPPSAGQRNPEPPSAGQRNPEPPSAGQRNPGPPSSGRRNPESPSAGQQPGSAAAGSGHTARRCPRRQAVAPVVSGCDADDPPPATFTAPTTAAAEPVRAAAESPQSGEATPAAGALGEDAESPPVESQVAPVAAAVPASAHVSPPPAAAVLVTEIAEDERLPDKDSAESCADVEVPAPVQVPGEFECDVCHRRLAHRHALARHRQIHFVRDNFQCDKCPRRYSRFDSLVAHSKKHASEAVHKCSSCPKAYRLRCLLDYHQREHEKEGRTKLVDVEAPRFECTECEKTFSYMTALRRHMRLHVGGQRFCCELCPKQYSRFDVLVLHSRVHSKLTPFECVICGRAFAQRLILEYHTSAHAGILGAAQPPFKCVHCGRSFPDAVQLREHRLRHAARRSLLCDMCGKEFASATKLRRHVMTHTGERPLRCDVCDRRFVDGPSLTQHRRTHSGERPFQCHVCGRGFSRNVTLKIHARTHSGEKPYPCGVCGRAFTTVAQLTRHSRVHSGERPYLCAVCGRGFSQTTHRKVHMRTHAPRPGDAPAESQGLEDQQHGQQEQHHSLEQHHLQQQEGHAVVQMTVGPPSSANESALQQHQLQQQQHQHQQQQQDQEHHELYTLQGGLSVVAPIDIEGNMTLHFMQQ